MRAGTASPFSPAGSRAQPQFGAQPPDITPPSNAARARPPAMPARAGQSGTDELARGRVIEKLTDLGTVYAEECGGDLRARGYTNTDVVLEACRWAYSELLPSERRLLESGQQLPANEAVATAPAIRPPAPSATFSIAPPPPRFSLPQAQSYSFQPAAALPPAWSAPEVGNTSCMSVKRCAVSGAVIGATTALAIGGYFFASSSGR